ncbi:hypothetical protein JYU04_03775 [Dehalococcoides mccartyi]|nr:hypothetical protein [Dehalococcoides mccartyi]
MNKQRSLRGRITVLLAVGATLAIITACSGSEESTPPTSTSVPVPTATIAVVQPTATPAPTEIPEPTVTPQPSATAAPEPTATPSGDAMMDDPMEEFDPDLLAQGKVIFDETAGGIGCAFCHGLDGKGNGPAGIGAPANRGLSMSKFEAALTEGESGAMEFLQGVLTASEKKAVIEYLGWLETQP